MKAVTILNHEVLIINLDEVLYEVKAKCPHMNYPLQLGSLKGRAMRCGFHYAEFNIASGKVPSQPTDAGTPIRGLRTYPVRVRNSNVIVELSD